MSAQHHQAREREMMQQLVHREQLRLQTAAMVNALTDKCWVRKKCIMWEKFFHFFVVLFWPTCDVMFLPLSSNSIKCDLSLISSLYLSHSKYVSTSQTLHTSRWKTRTVWWTVHKDSSMRTSSYRTECLRERCEIIFATWKDFGEYSVERIEVNIEINGQR